MPVRATASLVTRAVFKIQPAVSRLNSLLGQAAESRARKCWCLDIGEANLIGITMLETVFISKGYESLCPICSNP